VTCSYEYEHAKKIEAAKAERERQRRIRACAPEMLAMLKRIRNDDKTTIRLSLVHELLTLINKAQGGAK